MKKLLCFPLLFVFSVLIAGCGGGGGTTTNPVTRAISGTVKNAGESASLIDQPMEGVQVTVYTTTGTEVGTATTGSDGAYSITVPANGTYRVAATKSGYYNFTTVDVSGDNPATHQSVSDAVTSFDIYMVKIATDESNSPASAQDFMNWFRVTTMSCDACDGNTRFWKNTAGPQPTDINEAMAPAQWVSTVQLAYADLEAAVGKTLVTEYDEQLETVSNCSNQSELSAIGSTYSNCPLGVEWIYCGTGCTPNDDTGHNSQLHYGSSYTSAADSILLWLNTSKISAGDLAEVRRVALHEILQQYGGTVKTTNSNYVLTDNGGSTLQPFEIEMVRLHETLPDGWDMRQYSLPE